MTQKNAIVIDDNPANRDFLERLITQAVFDVQGASSGKAAISIIESLDHLELALVDMELPDINGLQLTQRIRERFPHAYIVVATMHDERTLMEKTFAKGGNCFLVKPHGFMELFKRLTTIDTSELINAGDIVIDQYGPRKFTFATK